MRQPRLLLTCEHGGNKLPAEFRLFMTAKLRAALKSHRGYDPGALPVAQHLQRALHVPLFYSQTSRLLVDLNRSQHHPKLISEFFQTLSREERTALLQTFYFPHRKNVEAAIQAWQKTQNLVVHIAVHSFSPVLGGELRQTELGLLYDPKRPLELAFCQNWQKQLQVILPNLRVRRNYPYRGASDGFASALRQIFGPQEYVGIELEINNRLLRDSAGVRKIAQSLIESLKSL